MTILHGVTKNLSPVDFEKPVDENLLDRFKENVAELKSFGIPHLLLWGLALFLLIRYEGIIGLGLFFAISITGLVILLFKHKKIEESFRRLGITETELKQAIDACNKRMQS